jgi:hypothetical protein
MNDSFSGVFMIKYVNELYKSLMIEQKLSEGSSCVYLFSFVTSMVKKMKVY